MGITVVSITLSQHNKFHLERRKWNEHTFSEQQCGVVVVLDRNFGNAHNFCSLLWFCHQTCTLLETSKQASSMIMAKLPLQVINEESEVDFDEEGLRVMQRSWSESDVMAFLPRHPTRKSKRRSSHSGTSSRWSSEASSSKSSRADRAPTMKKPTRSPEEEKSREQIMITEQDREPSNTTLNVVKCPADKDRCNLTDLLHNSLIISNE